MSTPAIVVAALLPILAIQPGTLLALERVQSDVVLSLFCWASVMLAQRGRWGWSTFLAVAAALMKPYAMLFAVGIVGLGIVGLGIDRSRVRAIAVGVAAALVMLLVPVARYLPESARAIVPRSQLFWASWQNWGLRSVGWAVDHPFAGAGRVLLCGLCLTASVLSWMCARRALRGHDVAATTMWLVLFTVAALEAVIGWSQTTYTYAMIYLLPGLLVIALTQPAIAERLMLTVRERLLLGPSLVTSLIAFWMVRPWWSKTNRPVAGFAVVAIVWLILTLAGASLLRRAPRPSVPDLVT